MALQQDDSYMTQRSSLSESLRLLDTQLQYPKNLRDAVGQGPTECFAAFPVDSCQTTAPSVHLGSRSNQFQNRATRDNWRRHGDFGSQEQIFASDCQSSNAQYPNQELTYTDEALFPLPYRVTDCSDFEGRKKDLTPATASPRIDSPPTMEGWSFMPEDSSSALHSTDKLNIKENPDEEEEGSGDKPYARLIHEALMQAPGHRMMLREIYDWFMQHTTKPSESGTNGWQNSIRHNLSMNQAFENDRMDPSNPSQQARKANSVWILTDEAVRHGVQSTTRYRKSGSNKKANRARVPAPLRQRSGAKGGRAARRAAKLRREEQMNRQGDSPLAPSAPVPGSYGASATDPNSQTDYFLVASPLTPESESAYMFPSPSEGHSYCYNLPDIYDVQTEVLRGQIKAPYGAHGQPKGDPCMKELLAYTYTSPTQPVTR